MACAVARRPQDFDLEPIEGETDTWTLFGETHIENPKLLVPDDIWPIVQLWHICRSEFGYAHLPDAGGASDQPAWTLDAFAILAAADAELRKAEPKV